MRVSLCLTSLLWRLGVTTILFVSCNLAAEEFPPFEKLPTRMEMPDPLLMQDGRRVSTIRDWETNRVPELRNLIQHYMYGFLPPKPTTQQARVERTNAQFLGGKATLREITLSFDIDGKPLPKKLHLLLITPNQRSSPVGAFIGLNFCGNHAVVHEAQVRVPDAWVYKSCAGSENERATDKGRGTQADVWNADLIIERGYALATFYSGDLDPDTPDFADGIAPFFAASGQPLAEDAPGSIACWAWGFHRVVDALVLPQHDSWGVDPKRIAVVGHSRNGKTALLAAALDSRISLAIPSQAGCGGTAPSRGKVGESVKQINDRFPHWFCDAFTRFNDAPEKLPFDQNCLLALCAPRPVLFSNAQEDAWANPDGQFTVLQGAEGAYALHGVTGLAGAMPEMSKLVGGRLGYFIRPGKHSMARVDWQAFLDFADQQWGTK